MQKTKITKEILRELGFVEEYNCWKLFEKGEQVNLIYKNQLKNKTLGDLVKLLTGTAHNIGFKKGSELHKPKNQALLIPAGVTELTHDITYLADGSFTYVATGNPSSTAINNTTHTPSNYGY